MYAPPTKLVSDVFAAVKRQFGDESGVQLETNDLIRWYNDAQTVINTKNLVLKTKGTIPAIIGQSSYTFPSQRIQQVDAINYAGVRIENVTFAQAEESIVGVDPLTTGTPILWYEWGGSFTFYPAPNLTSNIDIYFTQRPVTVTPTDILTLTLTIGLPDEYFPDIVSYMMQQAYEMDEDWQASGAKSQQFETSITEKGEGYRVSQNLSYQTITVVD